MSIADRMKAYEASLKADAAEMPAPAERVEPPQAACQPGDSKLTQIQARVYAYAQSAQSVNAERMKTAAVAARPPTGIAFREPPPTEELLETVPPTRRARANSSKSSTPIPPHSAGRTYSPSSAASALEHASPRPARGALS